ncbi:MAG: WbqC family protein [Mariprofundaceae bacterium]|nr:WbqC family protein [Mariprofundaceae bacterium]
MKLITIHQPNFLPWPGFFHKWMLADAMVLLDTVQYEKNEWQNRNRIKTASGAQWITVPVNYRYPQKIKEVTIADRRWVRKVCSSIEQSYAKAPCFEAYWPSVREVLNQPFVRLKDLNVALIRLVGDAVGCTSPLLLASELEVHHADPTERLIEICSGMDGDAYLSGQEGRTYLQREQFAQSGLTLYFQQIEMLEYPQLHGDFVPYLSVLDMLFNTGADAGEIIRGMGGMVR